jgi:hypothetical protein
MKASTFLAVMLGLMITTNFLLNLVARYGSDQETPTHLPNGAYQIKDLGDGWQIFRLDIGGKKGRLFLHRLYQNENSIEAITEIVNAPSEPEQTREDAE